MNVLTIPEEFAIVQSQVYRCKIFSREHTGYLNTLSLKCIVFLSNEAVPPSIRQWMDERKINFKHIGYTHWKPDKTWTLLNENVIKEGLEIILNAQNHPVLICCSCGVHETGALVACLRRLQRWNLGSILNEYALFAGASMRQSYIQFVELFDTDLVTLDSSAPLPTWFQNEHIKERIPNERLISEGITISKKLTICFDTDD